MDENNHIWAELAEQIRKCNYTKDEHIKMAKPNELRVMSLNIRSLSKNIDYVRENHNIFTKFDILCFCETNCNTDNLPNNYNDILIDGFHKPFTQNPYRKSNKGGGLAIYVNRRVCDESDLELLDIKLDHNPNLSTTPSCEYMFLKVNIKLAKSKNKKCYIIGNIYRSPSSNPSHFLENLDSLLSSLDRHKNKHLILAGDFNIDLVKYEYELNSQKLIDLTTRYSLIQVITKPTRVTDHSATLIDHIYTNQIYNMVSSGVITFDISDHLGTYITIALHEHLVTVLNKDSDGTQFNKVNAANLEKFQQLIENESWDEIKDETDTQLKYDKFIEIYSKHYETAFPKSAPTRRKNERNNPKPWILPWLEDACNRKNKLYHDYIKEPTIQNKIKYEKMKKFVNKHIKLAKNKYYESFFEKHSNNSRKQWQMLNSLLNRQRPKNSKIKLKDENGAVTSKPTDVAEKFNTYPNKIRRILTKHGVQLKSRSQAQKTALSNGRAKHPTFGKERTQEEKLKISSSVQNYWSKMSDEEYTRRCSDARDRWHAMPEEERDRICSMAIKAIQLAGKEGSKLEKFILERLTGLGYSVEFHKKNLIPNQNMEIDLYIPSLKTIIEVDGPSHFLPIWGQEKLNKQIKADSQKSGLILSKGFIIVRIKNLSDFVSLNNKEKLINNLSNMLGKIEDKFPPESKRFIEITL